MSSINEMIKRPKAKVLRRAYIKRMQSTDGLYENNWYEITEDVKKWGKLKAKSDETLINRFRFGSNVLSVANDKGRYNSEDDQASLWYNYANQQRSLVKLQVAFLDESLTTAKIWNKAEWPGEALWDADNYDQVQWDETGINYIGIISGDIFQSSKNEVALNIKPLVSIFQDLPASNLPTWTTTGYTAQEFIEQLRDLTSGGNYVFRQFFGNTSENWVISSTTARYANLNTSSSKLIDGKSVWEVIEDLGTAESFVPIIKNNGVFYFGPKDAATSTAQFEFSGLGDFNGQYGHTIKDITRYGTRISKYYSRVRLKWGELDTVTSYQIRTADFTVTASNQPWLYGHRTLSIENQFIGSSTVAQTITSAIWSEVSAIKKELDIRTSLCPQLELLDRVAVTYDSTPFTGDDLWDSNDWNTELIWSTAGASSLRFEAAEFKIIEREIDLDKLECKYVLREI